MLFGKIVLPVNGGNNSNIFEGILEVTSFKLLIHALPFSLYFYHVNMQIVGS